jgi:hypothetical protein
LFIVEISFFVFEPAPFVEILDDVDDMDAKQFHAAAVGPVEKVCDGYFGVVYCFVFFVYAACYIYVFRIHEKVFIHQSYVLQCAEPEEHEAT